MRLLWSSRSSKCAWNGVSCLKEGTTRSMSLL
eukprot:CAMPEP_0180253828 /NCGR_PEP_ID=MMETSP0987-20121128/39823_1 /TAXON_ID=697907 /ORGANISM="non described non described, Strain CCMP2293" /LENGTH=31 /DNA_ID= /DNA_START= /DNA_END= /DNA_ORIENTATION=